MSLREAFTRLMAWLQPGERPGHETFPIVQPAVDDPPPRNGVRRVEEISDESRDA